MGVAGRSLAGGEGGASAAEIQTSEIGAAGRTYLFVPYEARKEAYAMGARLDSDVKPKRWYIPPGVDPVPFARWAKPPIGREPTPDEIKQQFEEALRDAGLVLPAGHPMFDGKWHNVRVTTRKDNERPGSYIANFPEKGTPNGFIRNWDTGVSRPWYAQGMSRLSPAARDAAQAEAEAAARRRAAELQAQRADVAKVCDEAWNRMEPATEHVYLSRKGVEAFGVRMDRAGNLVVPLRDTRNRIWNLQRIGADAGGDKLYERDAQKTGRFHLIGNAKAADTLLFCEGYATGASLHMATGLPVVVAFDSGNLDSVIAEVRQVLKDDKLLVVAGDDDKVSAERIFKHLQRRARSESGKGFGLESLRLEELEGIGRPFALEGHRECIVDLWFEDDNGGDTIPKLRGSVRSPAGSIEIRMHNAGREKAMAACAEHGVIAVFPKFQSEAGYPTDFNDLHQREGLAQVRAQFVAALVEHGKTMTAEAVAARELGEGAEVLNAAPNGRYVGRVLGNTVEHAVQDVGRRTVVAHQLDKLDRVPEVGQRSRIVYREGRGVVDGGAAKDRSNER